MGNDDTHQLEQDELVTVQVRDLVDLIETVRMLWPTYEEEPFPETAEYLNTLAAAAPQRVVLSDEESAQVLWDNLPSAAEIDYGGSEQLTVERLRAAGIRLVREVS